MLSYYEFERLRRESFRAITEVLRDLKLSVFSDANAQSFFSTLHIYVRRRERERYIYMYIYTYVYKHD